jgi:hypothetical protein
MLAGSRDGQKPGVNQEDDRGEVHPARYVSLLLFVYLFSCYYAGKCWGQVWPTAEHDEDGTNRQGYADDPRIRADASAGFR